MKILIRVDASSHIGFGHVMRCLTLADALASAEVECAFVCRDLPGNAIDMLQQQGFRVFIPKSAGARARHATTLDIRIDEQFTRQAVEDFGATWLVVDHYGLDARWERGFLRRGVSVVAVDDLADRPHSVNVLIDQNLGRRVEDYDTLVATSCRCLIGPKYALLRPQFQKQRIMSQERRRSSVLRSLLISMGGTDEANSTGAILRCIKAHADILPHLNSIAVVMGRQAVWLEDVKKLAAEFPFATEVLVGVEDMATEMQRADLAIGAGGTTSWERCCLGLPSVIFTLAENQTGIAAALDEAGAAVNLGNFSGSRWQELLIAAIVRLQSNDDTLRRMSEQAFQVTDGRGVSRVCDEVFGVSVAW